MYGRHIREVIGEELYAKNLPYMRAALAGTPQHFDREIVDASGTTRYSQASYVPDVAADGTVLGFSVLVSDVTDRVLAEREADVARARAGRLSDKLRAVSELGASLTELDPDRVQDAVAAAVLKLGFDGAIIVFTDPQGAFRPRYGKGIFSVLDGARIARASTVTSEVLRAGKPHLIEDYAHYGHSLPEVRATGVRSLAAVPIRSAGETLGVLQAGRTSVSPVTYDEGEVLGLLAAVAGTSLRHARSFREMTRTQAELAEKVLVDPLTGLGNRRAADQVLSSVRPGDCLAMLDLDHFKQVNDERGHAAGDEVLSLLGTELLEHLRQRDRALRLGGEEFMLFLPSTSVDEASGLVDRLRSLWRERCPTPTFSVGLAVVGEDESGPDAQARADLALYRAKDEGRDRTVSA